MKKNLLVMLLLLAPFSTTATAGEGLYGTVGGGQISIKGDGIHPSGFMQKIIDTPGTVTSYQKEAKSTYQSLALGYCFNAYFCAEGNFIQNAKFSDTFTVHSVNIGVVDIGGVPVDFGTQPVNLTFQREAEASYFGIMGVAKFPITSWAEVYLKGGGIKYDIDTITKIPVYQGIALSEEKTYKGTVPIASLGFSVNPWSKLAVQFEFTRTKKVDMTAVNLQWKF